MNSKTLLPLFVFVLLLTPVVTLAQFIPLVGIPGITDPNANFEDYINTLYAISISVAGLVAVIKIIIAGVKWMLSDLVSSKQEAKSDIQGALIGLLIIISAVLILEVINPQLTQSRLFLDPVDRPSGSGSGSTATAAPTSPLPASSASAVTGIRPPITIACPERNCVDATRTCLESGGRVDNSGVHSASSLSCVYTTEVTLICLAQDSDGNPDCTAREIECERVTGNIWTQPDVNIGRGLCITPLPIPVTNR